MHYTIFHRKLGRQTYTKRADVEKKRLDHQGNPGSFNFVSFSLQKSYTPAVHLMLFRGHLCCHVNVEEL